MSNEKREGEGVDERDLERAKPAWWQPERRGGENRLNRTAYEELVTENLAWLERQAPSLARDHIIVIVKASVDGLYPPESRLSKDQPIDMLVCVECGVHESATPEKTLFGGICGKCDAKYEVHYFKAHNGKYYTTDTIEWPTDAPDHSGFNPIASFHRIKTMHAVCIEAPHGFPQFSPAQKAEEDSMLRTGEEGG